MKDNYVALQALCLSETAEALCLTGCWSRDVVGDSHGNAVPGTPGSMRGCWVASAHRQEQANILTWLVMSTALAAACFKLNFASWVCFSLGKFKTRSTKECMLLACFGYYVEWIKEPSGCRYLDQFIYVFPQGLGLVF